MIDNKIVSDFEIILNDLKDRVGHKTYETLKQSLDLINRQKAEIKRLQEIVNPKCQQCVSRTIESAKSEAIKEFAERLCEGRVSNDPVVIAVKTELKIMEEKEGTGR